MKKYIPNAVSSVRILGALALVFLPFFKIPFIVIYAVCVVFDFADGFLAKNLNAKTHTGDRLDHIASILFIVILALKYCAFFTVPAWALFTLVGIAIIKCASLVFGAVRFKKAPFIGSDWNKAAKCAFYLTPFWYIFAGMTFTCIVVLAIMIIATVEELIINVTAKEYNPETNTIIHLEKIIKKLKK